MSFTMDRSDVIAAEFQPGFASDQTYWQVYLRRSRWLAQKVVVFNFDSPYHNQVLWFWSKLSQPQVKTLWGIVERIGFQDFERDYRHETLSITDLPWYVIGVRFGEQVKEVRAYNLPTLAEYERQPHAIGLKELWDALTAHAPYGKVPEEQGLPPPWWRFW